MCTEKKRNLHRLQENERKIKLKFQNSVEHVTWQASWHVLSGGGKEDKDSRRSPDPKSRQGEADLDQVHITRNKEAWIVTEMGFKAPPRWCGEGIKRRAWGGSGWPPGRSTRMEMEKKVGDDGSEVSARMLVCCLFCLLNDVLFPESVCSFVPLGNVWQVVESVLNG